MKMLVTKLSNGRYRNEGELFAEPVSLDNVQLMGEMIALQAMRNVMQYDYRTMEKLFDGLVKDLHHMRERNYMVSDGYDFAQDAIQFLLHFVGRNVSETYSPGKDGKPVTIRCACFRYVDSCITAYRLKVGRTRQFDITNNAEDIADPVDCFDDRRADYAEADGIVEKMGLTAKEQDVLECLYNGMKRCDILKALDIGRGSLTWRKSCIRKKYMASIGNE